MPVVPQHTLAPVEYLPDTNLNSYSPASSDMLANYIASQLSHMHWLGSSLIAMCIIDIIALGYFWPLAILTTALTIAGAILIGRWDRQRTHVVLDYNLDSSERGRYDQLCTAVQAFTQVRRVVRVEARHMHGDWKNQAGASTSITTQPVSFLSPSRPAWLEANVPVWGMQWRQGNLSLLFLPDRVLVAEKRKGMVLKYRDLSVSATLGRFIEQAGVSADAQVVGMTWQHPNKNGGPDKRYANNRQWPVSSVTYITLSSATGLNLTLQASNNLAAQAFVHALQTYMPLLYPEQAIPVPSGAMSRMLPGGSPPLV